MSRLPALAVAGALALGMLVGGAVPASAHDVSPSLFVTYAGASPSLPTSVSVAVIGGQAQQLLVTNPDPTPLAVLGDDGRPFLSISSAGVQADVARPAYWASAGLSGVAGIPPEVSAAPQAAAHWVTLSQGDTWGWYDPRVQPGAVSVPATVADAVDPVVLRDWRVPARYGSEATMLTGQVTYVATLGSVGLSVEHTPAGVSVEPLPDPRLPGLFVSSSVPLTVLGADGRPFARFTGTRVEVEPASPTWVAEQEAEGRPTPGTPGTGPPVTVSTGPTWRWLDARLAYRPGRPSRAVLLAARRVVIGHWSIPVVVAGRADTLSGSQVWLPSGMSTAAGAPASGAGSGGGLPGGVAIPVAVLLAAVLGAGALVGRNRRRSRPAT